ncbi:Na+/H+ antiporter subunit E [Schaalia naturae]|uniref:Na+/H+ antiporter subunit E n=1 Tax=Schaalia naturae TaxID=635203 RepID=A0ABW2SQJ6_9ACTO
MWRALARTVPVWRGNSVPRGPGARGRLSPGLTVWLTFLWVMVFGDLSWMTVLGGILASLAVQWAFPLPHSSSRWHVRPGAVTVLLARFVADVIRAGLQVSWLVLSGRPVRSAIVRVDLRSADPVHLTGVSAMTSLVPGTIVVRVDRLTGTIYLHVLDLERQGGVEAVRSSVLDQERRILLAIGSNADLRAAGVALPLRRGRARPGKERPS